MTRLFVMFVTLTVLATAAHSPSVYANPATYVDEATVVVDEAGEVSVVVGEGRDAEELQTTNGKALLRAGQIADGDTVSVRITPARGHKHRGHVTILK